MKKKKILDIPISPNINKSNAFEQTRQQLLPKMTQGLEGAFYVEEYKFSNDSVYKGQMRVKQYVSAATRKTKTR